MFPIEKHTSLAIINENRSLSVNHAAFNDPPLIELTVHLCINLELFNE